ncbi:sensor histidine kinase [Sandarakinorhabdus sp. DWP1-3-1]|uniref:sensor histidine kinase n=1 Tax=Sandarakinorhabdus sp. DWP1-3-1 TaxID=2804627 RepID=UPI003CF64679
MHETPLDAFDAMSLPARAAAVRSGARFSIPGMIIMTLVLIFIRWRFGPLVRPAWLLDLWLTAMFAVVGFWLVAIISFYRRRPDDADTVEHWPRFGIIARKLLNIGIALSPWVLLRGADVALQYFTTLMYVWYVGVSIISANPAARLAAWEVLLLTVAVAGFAIYSDVELGLALALLLVAIGASMLGLQRLVQRTVLAALEAEQVSAASATATREALAIVATERDAKARFIASASHDLQQPVYAARLGIEAALALPAGERHDEAVRGAAVALQSAQGLIDTMIEYLRLDSGAVAVRPQSLPTAHLLNGIAREYRVAAEATGMRIRIVGSAHAVMADPQLVGRAIGNIVHNAIRHSGGRRLLLAARRRRETVEIWAIDDGCGLASDSERWLFEDFAKGNTSLHRGLGLGLVSARRQLAMMGGSIRLVSQWQRGTAFLVELPAA